MIDQLEPRRMFSSGAPSNVGGLTFDFTNFEADTGIKHKKVYLSNLDDTYVNRQEPFFFGASGPYIYKRVDSTTAILKEHVSRSQTITLHFTTSDSGTADWVDDIGLERTEHLQFTVSKAPRIFAYIDGSTITVLGTPEADQIEVSHNAKMGKTVVVENEVSQALPDGIALTEGLGYNVAVIAEAGDDEISIEAPGQMNRVDGGFGNDVILSTDIDVVLGLDTLEGGYGNDRIECKNRPTLVYGDEGNDELAAGNADTYLFGGNGNDTLHGGDGNDTLTGGGGRDLIFGGAGNDRLNGNGGNDTLSSDSGNDRVYGGNGNDSLYGGSGTDRLYGEAGDDYLKGDKGPDHLDGGDGTNHATADEDDQLIGILT